MSVTWKHAAENLSFSQLSQSMRLRVLRVVWFSSWHFTHPSLTFSKECVWICTTFSFSNSSPKLPIIPTQVVQTIKKTKRHNIAEKKLKWLLFYDVFAPKYFFWNNLFSRAPHKPSENRLSGVIYIVRALLMSHDSEWLPVILVPPPPQVTGTMDDQRQTKPLYRSDSESDFNLIICSQMWHPIEGQLWLALSAGNIHPIKKDFIKSDEHQFYAFFRMKWHLKLQNLTWI